MSSETEWRLIHKSDLLEIEDTEDASTVRMRDHYTLVRSRKRNIADTVTSDTRKLSGVLQYSLGGITKTKSLPSSKKYMCVSDEDSPASADEGDQYVIQVQQWEYYSPWEDVTVSSNGLPAS